MKVGACVRSDKLGAGLGCWVFPSRRSKIGGKVLAEERVAIGEILGSSDFDEDLDEIWRKPLGLVPEGVLGWTPRTCLRKGGLKGSKHAICLLSMVSLWHEDA